MSFARLFFIVLGLTMDTLAVACAISLHHPRITPRLVFRVPFHFALFQAGLLFVGGWAGNFAERYFGGYDHWIAFGLLMAIGLKMLWESFSSCEDGARSDPSRGLSLVVLSVGTSLDALAVGGSLGLLGARIGPAVLTAWVMTVLISAAGLFVGKKVGCMFGRRAELLGGLVLCGIGIKILLAHLSGS